MDKYVWSLRNFINHCNFCFKVNLRILNGKNKVKLHRRANLSGEICPAPDRLWLSMLEAMCPLKNAVCSWLPEHPWRLLCISLLRGPWRIQITHLEIYGKILLENVFEGTQMNILFSWLQKSDSSKSQAKFYFFSLSLSTKHPLPHEHT